MKIHIVQKGDTLWKIAKKYGVNFEELKKMNSQLSNPDMIMPGMKIKVPTAGGTVKKEAPMTGVKPEAKINMGAKKEMPKFEHPFAKEKPLPVVEAPQEMPKKVAPIQELPKMEKKKPVSPIQQLPKMEKQKPAAPIQELPKMEKQTPVSPIQELPKMEKPKEIAKEAPKAPYSPKMPQPVIPEMDINQYYMQNMANMSVPQQPKPQIPPKPTNIFPGMIKEETSPAIKEDESPLETQTQQGGYQQPMYPYPPNSYPISPVLPGSGYNYPGGFQPQQSMNFPQVQGMATMPMQQMPMQQMPMQQMPMQQMPMQQMPMQQGMMPAFESPDFDESSPFMPQMPQMQGGMDYQMPLMPQVQGAMDYQAPLMPQVQGAEESPDMMAQMPAQISPAAQMPYMPCPPMGYPVSPIMQGPGFGYCPPPCPPFGYQMAPMPLVQGAMDYQMPFMPQVQGAMNYQAPFMPQVQGAMDYQAPFMPQVQGAADYQMPPMPQAQAAAEYQMPPMPQVQGTMESPDMAQMPPQMPVQGINPAADDCGCGPGPFIGQPGPQMGGAPFGPSFGPVPGTAPIYTPHYGQYPGFAQPPFMNPYGYGQGQMGGSAYGMPRYDDESSEYEG